MIDTIDVHMAAGLLPEETTVGTLSFRHVRGREYQEFVYAPTWLRNGFSIDPALPLIAGSFRSTGESFGCFSDASPDRWGRALIRRSVRQKSVSHHKNLFESEYLLKVSDSYRLGALRFYLGSTPLAPDTHGVPPLQHIVAFEATIRKIQEGVTVAEKEFQDILSPGSSLGGARPKMSIVDTDGVLWLAKFSNISDAYDVPAREAISLEIARQCHLNVPDFRLMKISEERHALLVKRFDRNAKGRIPFMSSMTLLQAIDGQSDEYAYLDIAEAIQKISRENAASDLKELWRRMVVNICIANRDDHLRNHGFLWNGKCWCLSPVYDLEISPEKSGHALALNDSGDVTPDLDIPVEVAPYYGIPKDDATAFITFVKGIASEWLHIGKSLSIFEKQLRQMPDMEFG